MIHYNDPHLHYIFITWQLEMIMISRSKYQVVNRIFKGYLKQQFLISILYAVNILIQIEQKLRHVLLVTCRDKD